MSTPPIILYVEDDERSRRVMQMIATDMEGADLIIFQDSTDFMARAGALTPKPNVILLDIHMKPYTGFEMLAMLRQSDAFRDTPVVAVTASVMNEEVAQLQTAGFDGCLAKPLDMDTFPDTLKQILDGEVVWRIVG